MSIFEHELKTDDLRIVLNSARQHVLKVGHREEIDVKSIKNSIEGLVSTADKQGDARFSDFVKYSQSGTNVFLNHEYYLNKVIGSKVYADIYESFEHDSSDPQILLGIKEENREEAVFKTVLKPEKNSNKKHYVYQIKGSDNNPDASTARYYYASNNNALLQPYPYLDISDEELDALDEPLEEFYPVLCIHKPFKGDLSELNAQAMRSDALGYVFNYRATLPLMGTAPIGMQCVISLGKLNARYYGGNYYTFVVKANGEIKVMRSELTGQSGSGHVYKHAVVKNLKADFFTLNQFETGGITCIVMLVKDSMVVTFTTIENFFVATTDEVNKIVAKSLDFLKSNETSDIFVSSNKKSVTIVLRNRYDVYSMDATIYADKNAFTLFSGYPLKFKQDITFVFPWNLPIFSNYDMWNTGDLRLILLDADGRKTYLSLDGSSIYNSSANTTYYLSFVIKNPISNLWVDSNSSVGGFCFIKVRIVSHDLDYFLKGISGILIHKTTVLGTINYNNYGGIFPKKFIKSIRIQRGHYNDSNTCQVEFIIAPQDKDWNNDYELMLRSSVVSIEIYYKNRLIFSGISVIDNFKTREKAIKDKVEYVTINFEEDWLRRLKENSVIVQENLTLFRTHSQALKYIMVEKLGLDENDMIFAEDNIPLPLVMETSDNTEYVMVIGKDYYSYVDNIVSNFSGWTLYRNYALNEDNANNIKLVYKPKPLFVNSQPLRATFYSTMEDYMSSTELNKAKIISALTIEEKRPFATDFVALRPTTDIRSIATDYVIRSELIDNPNVPDFVGFPIHKHVFLPYRYDKHGQPQSIDLLLYELALRLLYGNRIARFRATFLPHLHYYSLVYIQDIGYGVIKSMQIDITNQITCEYVVTLETGGLMYQW